MYIGIFGNVIPLWCYVQCFDRLWDPPRMHWRGLLRSVRRQWNTATHSMRRMPFDVAVLHADVRYLLASDPHFDEGESLKVSPSTINRSTRALPLSLFHRWSGRTPLRVMEVSAH